MIGNCRITVNKINGTPYFIVSCFTMCFPKVRVRVKIKPKHKIHEWCIFWDYFVPGVWVAAWTKRTPIDFFVYVQCSQVKTYRMGLCIGWNFLKSKFTIKEIVYVWWRQIESNAQRVVPIDCWSQRFFWWKKYIRYIIVGWKTLWYFRIKFWPS